MKEIQRTQIDYLKEKKTEVIFNKPKDSILFSIYT